MRNYKLIDWLTQGYLALVGLMIVAFHGSTVTLWPWRAALHVALMAGVHGLIALEARRRSTPGPAAACLRLLRAFYPMLLFTLFYAETHDLDCMFRPAMDGAVIDLDERLFGQQLCRTLMKRHPALWVSECFHLFYFSYYVMVAGVGFGLYVLRRRRFCAYLTVVAFVFYACYLTYILLPVRGPYGTSTGETFHGALASVEPREVPDAIRVGPFFRVMQVIYVFVEPEGGAAMPSSHVAVAVTTLWFSWTFFRRARYIHLVAAVMLCLSTVYCGYHYASDVLAGLATGGVLAPVGLWLHRRCGAAEGDATCAPAGGSDEAPAQAATVPR